MADLKWDEKEANNPYALLSYEEGFNDGLKEGWTKGELTTLRKAINNLKKNLNLSEEEAMDALGLPSEIREDLVTFYKNFHFML